MKATVIQISDLHLYADPEARFGGVVSGETLAAVLRYIEVHEGDVALLVVSGDIAEDARPETYARLAALLGPWRSRCRVIPGNHDHPGSLRGEFADRVPADAGPLTFWDEVAGWCIIGLDSHLPGQITGRVDTEQLEWLEETLARAPNMPSVVFVHHPPGPVGSPAHDANSLLDPAPLLDLLRSAPQVRAVACGHVHQAFDGDVAGVRMLTSPSTAVQFRRGELHAVTAEPPGYRRFTLGATDIETEAVWLPSRA